MKRTPKHLLFLCVIGTVLQACTTPSKLEEALRLGGDNRRQLEKVLQHYTAPEDSLKLKAARFLIANMPGHYTLRGDKIDHFRQMIDQAPECSYYYKKLYDITLDHFIQNDKNIRHEEDVEHISADFLIRHIDATFEVINRHQLLEFIPFNLILEHLLPYRFEYERLDLWRDSLPTTVTASLDDPFPEIFNKIRSTSRFFHGLNPNITFINNLLRQNPLKDCYFTTYNTLFSDRVMGIPSIMDHFPFYSNRNGYHYWCVDLPLISKELNIVGTFDRRSAKVYRHTFSPNPTLSRENEEFIPELFLNPFRQDVTSLYYYTTDIKIENATTSTPRYAYLCVFNNLQWKPIAAGEVSRGQVEFKQLVKNIAYLPAYYNSPATITPLNYPFILDTKGEITFLIPDKQHTHMLHLERKNPDLSGKLLKYATDLNNTIIEASNDKNFSHPDTVFILKQEPQKLYYASSNIHPVTQYRWYRMKEAPGKHIAELYFFDAKNNPLRCKIHPSDFAVIDGNPLTAISLDNHTLTFDFETTVTIDKLVCLPRNDGNGIYPTNVYELLYFDLDGWHSLGLQEGNNFYLEYDNVPRNALYWLRNLTTGVEERIFTYSHGRIIFW